MSDSEHEVETFETADAGASHTVPMQAGSVRKGGFMVRTTRCVALRWDAMRCDPSGCAARDSRAYGRARDVRMGAYTRDMIGVKCLRALRRGVCVGAPLGGVVTCGGGGIGENPGGGVGGGFRTRERSRARSRDDARSYRAYLMR